MNTEAFDHGTFWLIINPEPVLMIISVMGLGIVAFGYAYVLALMTVLRNQKRREGHSPLRNNRLQTLLSQRKMIQIRHRWLDVTGFHGRYRKYWVRCCLRRFGLSTCMSSHALLIEPVAQIH